MKGIILSGGMGTRLHPLTKVISKQLLPVYNKPMIYYPLSLLMFSGITEILLISTPHDLPMYQRLLGDGSQLGLNLSYAEQPRPEGLAQAFIIGSRFAQGQPVSLILGDNIFYGEALPSILNRAAGEIAGATVFCYRVKDPQRYGVINFDRQGRPMAIEEKPANPRSNWAVTGLYFYDEHVIDYAKELKPSPRGELEISDLNLRYLQEGSLKAEKLGRGIAWLDAGTHKSLLEAANYIAAIEERQGFMVACIEEVAFRLGYIKADELERLADLNGNKEYGDYLRMVLREQQ